jgi:hypothetical protein
MPARTYSSEEAHQRKKESIRQYAARGTRAAADVAPIPDVVDADRRAACESDLLLFLRTYFADGSCSDPFSRDQARMILRIQQCCLQGGRFVQAVPRGLGKTTISQLSVLWSVMYGHRKFVILFGANMEAGRIHVDSIKSELEQNLLLAEDFPEVCTPVRHLEGLPHKCKSQHNDGERTFISWKAEKLVLPAVKGSVSAGAVIMCKGLLEASRGLVAKREHDGAQVRPDFVVIDDPQTDESARSRTQSENRMQTIKRTILKLAGHQKEIASVVNATVIDQGDLIENLMDSEKSPGWQCERIKFVQQWADRHDDLWMKEYAGILQNYDPATPNDVVRARMDASAFYKANREAMDAGCEVVWEYAYDRDKEISAIQHAYNAFLLDGEEVFEAEFQNNPRPRVSAENYLNVREISTKISRYKRGEVPLTCQHVTAMVDLGAHVHWYAVAAWQTDFSGWIIDYGAWPNQQRHYFTGDNARFTFDKRWPGAGLETKVRAGLQELVDDLFGREYKREDGSQLQIERLLIDANWGATTDTVYAFLRDHQFRQLMMPSHGRYIGAAREPLNLSRVKTKKHGEHIGLNWYIPAKPARQQRYLVFDSNYWKSFVHSRLATKLGDRGCLTLFNAPPNQHRMLADHLTAEFPTRTFGRGRQVDEWRPRPGAPDNHLFDCLVGVCLSASLLGLKLQDGEEHKGPVKRRKVSLLAGMRSSR